MTIEDPTIQASPFEHNQTLYTEDEVVFESEDMPLERYCASEDPIVGDMLRLSL